jgi:hypothetical protein
MKSANQILLEIGPAVSDRTVAMMLADKCVALTDAPYRFAVRHDIRPPKNLACAVAYEWTRKDLCGVEWKSKPMIRKWLTDAFLYGYTVYQMNAQRTLVVGFSHSIAIARRRAALHQMPKVDNDEDIPF